MKIFKFLILCIFLVSAANAEYISEKTGTSRQAQPIYWVAENITGEVYKLQNNIFVLVKEDEKISSNTKLKTFENSNILLYNSEDSNTSIYVEENSEFIIREANKQEKINSLIELLKGSIHNQVSKNIYNEYKIITPVAVAGVRGTEFDVEYNEEDQDVAVYDGEVEVENKFSNKKINLKKNHYLKMHREQFIKFLKSIPEKRKIKRQIFLKALGLHQKKKEIRRINAQIFILNLKLKTKKSARWQKKFLKKRITQLKNKRNTLRNELNAQRKEFIKHLKKIKNK